MTTIWSYDALNRVASLTEGAESSDERTTLYRYTPKGLLAETQKPSGIILRKSYDALDHLIAENSSDNTISYEYTHDRLGRLLSSHDLLLNTTHFKTYDAHGRVLSETLPNGAIIQNRYDLSGRRIEQILPDNSSIQYQYDALRLRQVNRVNREGEILYSHTFKNYDLRGFLIAEGLIQNLGTLTHTYDLAGRPLERKAPGFLHAILSYDAVGNVLTSQLQEERLSYTYDALYQLTSENLHQYEYDALYNRLLKDNESYNPNPLNQYPSEFVYDADGNPLEVKGASYTYDALGRVLTITQPSTRLSFTYDALHRRLSKVVEILSRGEWFVKEKKYFLYDGQNEIGAMDEEGVLSELRVLGRTPQAEIGSAIALELHGKIFAPIHDLYDNVSKLLSCNAPSEEYRYTVFGEELTSDSSSGNPWKFSSKRLDPETDLVYYGRRYYLPSYGRWLTPDPLGFDAGPNMYAFVSNAPLTHVDLYGFIGETKMDLMINERLKNPRANTWNSFKNPRVQGSLQAIGGLAEASLGYGISCLPGGITAPIGGLLAYHGLDHFAAGMTKALYGRPTESFTSQGLQKFGLSRDFSSFMDNGIGMIGGLGSANILSRGNFFKNFTNNFRFPINSRSTYTQKNQILFGQNSVSPFFSEMGNFNSKPIFEVVHGLRNGTISREALPIEIIIRNEQKITLNNRSLLALRRAGMEPKKIIDRTGIQEYETLLNRHLKNNMPSDVIRIRGGPPGTSFIGSSE